VIFAITSHITTANIFERQVLDKETHIDPKEGFTQNLMLHFNRFHFSCNAGAKNFKQHGSTGIAIFMGDFPSLEPRQVRALLQHVATIPPRNGHPCYYVRVGFNFLN
ncbi:hypothetical protein Celaphus_00000794, partial [Cervus elaphus hippelaphus]